MVPPPACSAHAETASISEGGRAQVNVVLDQAGETFTIANTPEGWNVANLSDEPAVLEIRPPYGAEGHFEIALATDCGANEGTATIEVEVHKIATRDISAPNGPDAREHPLMWIDSGDPNRLLVFGGFSFVPHQYTVVWDVWSLDLASSTWTLEAPSGTVPHLASGRVAPIPGERAVLHFGGSDQQNNTLPDVTRFDYAPDAMRFTALSTTAVAASSALGALVYDQSHDRFLSVCGFTGADVVCDVRAYYPSDAHWERLIPADDGEKPTGRYGFFSVHDPETDRLIIFSGAQYPTFNDQVNPAQDTWALELAEDPPRWVKIDAQGAELPPGRRNGCVALDPLGHRMFVFGGTPDAMTTSEDLWVLSLDRGTETWTKLGVDIPIRSSGAGAYDAARKRILFGFGNTGAAIYDDLWALEL